MSEFADLFARMDGMTAELAAQNAERRKQIPAEMAEAMAVADPRLRPLMAEVIEGRRSLDDFASSDAVADVRADQKAEYDRLAREAVAMSDEELSAAVAADEERLRRASADPGAASGAEDATPERSGPDHSPGSAGSGPRR